MSRWFLTLVLTAVASAQAPPAQAPPKPELQKQRPKPATSGKEEVPPEEDKSLSVDSYSFNPLQAQKDLTVGNYYFKQHKYRAAETRFHEALKWNDGFGDAWLRLGEVEEKLKDPQAAKQAYAKYLEVAPDAKNADEIRKKMAKLK
ncbi:MAG TPA: tetratricopeptide repeat protein [Bryobacteraceae bacterium]|jgi:tetratricopeptide (TPR) repeat protein